MNSSCDAVLYRATRTLAEHVGSHPWREADDDERVPAQRYRDAWDEIGNRTASDPWFSARAGLEGDLGGQVAAVAFACGTKATVADGLEALARFYRIIIDAVTIEVHEDAEVAHVIRRDTEGESSFAESQFALATILLVLRRMVGVPVEPRAAWFQHAGDDALAAAGSKIFSAVQFGQASNSLLLDRATLQLPLVRAEPELSQVLDNAIERALAKLPETAADTIVDLVRQDIATNLTQDATLTGVAGRLAMHERTLQRRLKEASSSHKEILDRVRMGLAEQQVAGTTMSFAEVAFLTGFSEPAAFSRAFKGWFGRSPSQFRSQS